MTLAGYLMVNGTAFYPLLVADPIVTGKVCIMTGLRHMKT